MLCDMLSPHCANPPASVLAWKARAILAISTTGSRSLPSVTDGKLREPVVLIASIARAFHAKTDAGGLAQWGDSMSQSIFHPATVFNFFPPVNSIAGTTLNGPEFAIFDTNTSLARMNFIDAVYGALGANTKLDFSPVINAGTPDQMVAWLDTLFLHGSTPNQMKQIILTAVDAVDPTDTTGQAQAAIYLYTSSSLYQVQHRGRGTSDDTAYTEGLAA